jgi:hypothetical protein
MSYEEVKDFEYRGFKCEITRLIPTEPNESTYHEFCITEFVKPTTLDKILFFGIGEGVRSDAIAALIDLIGLSAFYPGDFNKDVENIMKIGIIRHEEHIGCYTTDHEGDHWKYMNAVDMEAKKKQDIDIYHDSRKRLIDAMKLYHNLAQRMQEIMKQIEIGQIELPKV